MIREPNWKVRRPAVAGQFYPADAHDLRQTVEQLFASAEATKARSVKAVISPHAGYIYSGPVAASAFAQLAPDRDQIRRVVLLGPSHFVPFSGLALSSADFFETPLGLVPIDSGVADVLNPLQQVCTLDAAHAREHSLEVQLPFLQVALGDPAGRPPFTIVPLVVGEASATEVSEVLEMLWGGVETRFVISSDLSHYLDAPTARRLDGYTARAIEQLKPELLGDQQACGRVPILGLLEAARHHHLKASTVDLRNSGDTGGPANRVVGYGAFALSETPG